MTNKNSTNKFDLLIEPIQRFLRIEAAGGIILITATIGALIWANSSWGDSYHEFWHTHLSIKIGNVFKMDKSLLYWINDGLMAIFFFVVGLEIKRELIAGELSSLKKASLPIAAAIGGMVLPALIYTVLNKNPELSHGWGIPMATDIAFSLGILSLLGKRVPIVLKVFLVAFAIVDDLGAVLIIALFYSEEIVWSSLITGFAFLGVLFLFNWLQVKTIHIYMIIGWIIWYLFYKSGIHPTIAGVLVAVSIPVNRSIRLGTFREKMLNTMDYFCESPNKKNKITLNHRQLAAIDDMQEQILKVQSPLQRLEHTLHGFVTFFIMPVFALANAGVVVNLSNPAIILSGISLIIAVSLIFGKIGGVFIFSWLSVKAGLASLPDNLKWKHIFGLGILGGIGFTMSLFISNLAFTTEALLNPAKIGIFVGSVMAGVAGYFVLKATLKKDITSKE